MDVGKAHSDADQDNLRQRHMPKFHFIYELPIGPGKTFLNNRKPLSQVAGGWRFSGLGRIPFAEFWKRCPQAGCGAGERSLPCA
jgi:hypothetical protein